MTIINLESLDTQTLPVLPPGATTLLKTLSDEEMDFLQLAKAVEIFPTIAARLISVANSAWSSPVLEITSLEEACSRLGFNVVRSTSIALLVSAPFNSVDCQSFDISRFWGRALLVAETASLLEQAMDNPYAGSCRTAGLLHNLGLLLMVSQLPQPMNQFLQWHKKDTTISLRKILTEGIGFDYCVAGGLLAERWELPNLIKSVMLNHHDCNLQGIEGISSQAVLLVESVEAGLPLESLHPDLDIAPIAADKIFSQIQKQFDKTIELSKVLFGKG